MKTELDQLAEQLAVVPIFEGFSAKELLQMARVATVEEFSSGEVVLHQGRNSRNLWVVLEGKCQVVKMTGSRPPYPVDLAELVAGDHFGEMSFFHAAPHSASVQALDRAKLLRIDREDFDALVEEGSLAAYRLLLNSVEELADRLRRMDDWVTELLCGTRADRKTRREWTQFRETLFTRWSE